MIIKIGTLYLVANIFEKAIAFFLLPIFTNLLSADDYGVASTYISYLNIFSVFVSLALGNSLRGAIVDYKDDIDEYVSSIFILQIILGVVFSIIIIFIGINVFADKYLLLVILCPIHACFLCIISTLSLQYMLQFQYIKRTIYLVVPNFISILMSIFLIKKMTHDYYRGRVLGMFSISAIFAMVSGITILLKGKASFKKKYCVYALNFSIPLIFHGLSLIILNSMDRIMIAAMYSTSEAGIYSVAYSFGTLSIAFTTAMNDVWIPWFYDRMRVGDNGNIRMYSKEFTWICVFLSCGVMLLSPDIFKLFTNKAYWNGIIVIPFLVVGNYFSSISSLPINAMYYSKKTKMIAISSLVAMFINLVANYVLIPQYGASGAAFATICSYFILFLLQNLSVVKQFRNLFDWKVFVPQSITVICFAILTYIFLNMIWFRWGLAVIFSALWAYFTIMKWHIIEFMLKRKEVA